MLRYLGFRMLQIIPIVVLASIGVFLMIHLVPGDPVLTVTGLEASADQMERVRQEMGFDQPLVVQYVDWVQRVVSGDLGNSLVSQKPVAELIADRMPATIQLTIATMAIGLALGIPFGLISASRKGSWIDKALAGYSSLSLAVPTFVVGIVFILVFGVTLEWLPTASSYIPFWDDPGGAVKATIGPAFTLGFFVSGVIARFVRASMVEVLDLDYIRTARAKGVGEAKLVYKHAFRAASLPTLTVVGIQFGTFLGGSLVTESVFNYPGIGRLILSAILNRDFVVVQGAVLVVVIIFTLVNLATDVLYSFLNPRIRAGSSG
ncbi:ABC transporter permease [Ilumatobacter sp.]|uniref:ABC transporter permease n=1 Tax=Ilumatobacter sp. TaxID=1967498 RepID=UPI003752F662